MPSPNKRLRLSCHLALAAGIAVAALAVVSSVSEAQYRGGYRGMGSRMQTLGGGSRWGGGSRRDRGRYSDRYDKPGYGDGGRRPRYPFPRRPPYGIGVIGPGIVVDPIDPDDLDPPPPPPPRQYSRGAPPSRGAGISIPPNNEQRFVPDEVLLEFAANYSPQAIAQLLQRHGMVQLEAQAFTLTNSLFVRARITARRSVRATLRRLRSEAAVRTGQANFIYSASQQAMPSEAGPAATIQGPADATPKATPVVAAAGALPGAGDPAQYALAKLRLTEAHRLATGDQVLVAVIDSGIDLGHPELQGVVAGSYDALGRAEPPHVHGTAIAGAISAHARLMGAAPAARLLAIRAFGSSGNDTAEAITSAILKGIEYAVTQNARVINMSFAGPADPAMSRFLADADKRGVVLIAASGNLGPKSAPQYPAADPNVIAVSATDANDKMFKASTIGRHIALTAPGVDILLPAPNADYQLSSGTSFSAAYVSGVAALVLQRAPALKPNAVRAVLQETAKDLGPRGKDRQYGAGLVDAYRAIVKVQPAAGGRPQEASSRAGPAR
jgi:hypothetical protein